VRVPEDLPPFEAEDRGDTARGILLAVALGLVLWTTLVGLAWVALG
jgi:hypothetical protein